MKKLLVLLLTICIAFSSVCVVAFAEAEPVTDGGSAVENNEEKTVESLVGAFYLQGESGAGLMGSGIVTQSEHDYQIADKMAANLNGTNKIPFYAFDKDGSVFFDSYAEDYFFSETNAAKAAGIDFFAYNLYMGYDTSSPANLIKNMNRQLIYHSAKYDLAEFTSKINYAVVIDGDYDSTKAKERDILIDKFLTQKGYQTATDGRPVVFIVWNENIATQIERLNKDLKKIVADGANPDKAQPKTALNDDVEKMYVIALNAPSYQEAIGVGADAVSCSEGTGKSGEAYTNMTAKVEANWATGEKVVPNVVTGFDKTLLAGDKAIEITAKKASNSKELTVRYSRSGAADDYVAKATAEELVAHTKKAVETTNKPAEFNAVMFYAWDDFLGGAFLCPTKTDKVNQYDTTYLKALRGYFYGKTEGMPALSVLDNSNNVVTTEEDGTVTTTTSKGEVLSKVDKDGNNLLANSDNQQGNENNGGNNADYTLYIIIGAAAVVIIAVAVIVIVAVSKKKKKAAPAEEKTEE